LAATRLGLKSYLVLKGKEPEVNDGNLFLDNLAGARIKWITEEEYRTNRNGIMSGIA